jgi:ATP phosphoribosyltransferase regulatory subunit
MVHPLPSGTRDVLPQEAAELRQIGDALREVFLARGYGEIHTPALEYEEVMARGDLDRLPPAFRLFDEHGNTLILRTEMTTPIARVVASRYADASLPLRFCYQATCYRAVRPQRGQSRELVQTGVELIGSPAPTGTAEVLSVLVEALAACGLRRFRVGVGDASFYPKLMATLGVPEGIGAGLHATLGRRDLVALEERVRAADLPEPAARLLIAAPQLRGDISLLERLEGEVREAAEGLLRLAELLEGPVLERLIFDLGLVREIGYYTGAVFEVYDPALGQPLGGGGRYDDLLARFGRPLPAVGFALNLEGLHIALAGEERGER